MTTMLKDLAVTGVDVGTDRAAQPLTGEELAKTHAYWRACNYLAAGMIYLRDNPLLREPLKEEHVKLRLLGHWGASPGLSFTYVHLNRLINKYDLDAIFLAGPGHGAPGRAGAGLPRRRVFGGLPEQGRGRGRACGSSSRSSPSPAASAATAPRRRRARSTRAASWATALSHAFGAAFDNPDLLVAVMVGDGEVGDRARSRPRGTPTSSSTRSATARSCRSCT